MKLYRCDPSKNIECKKTLCFLSGGPCHKTSKEEYKMKKLKIFKKKDNSTPARPIMGITDAEYNKLHDALREAYEAACDRQKSCDAKPSGYMKGLREAIIIVDTIKPHALGWEDR